MNKFPATRIGVKRIVIEVNRDLTAEQLEILDEALRRLGLVKTTRVTLHSQGPRKPQPPRGHRMNPNTVPSTRAP